ncbi:MAG: hypothetical protein HY275_02290 [Gemmatimonadetes bacterium]|nr:hypothetical protein [Gemmatimonadota bacterium]
MSTPTLRTDGSAVVYRLYDVGDEVHLDAVLDLLATSAPERIRLVRGEAQALQIVNPPVSAVLGTERAELAGEARDVEIGVRLYAFGVAALRMEVRAPPDLAWDDFVRFGMAVQGDRGNVPVLDHHVQRLLERIGPAIVRPQLARVTEDYTVFRLRALRDAEGRPVPASALADAVVAPLLLGETRPLADAALRELLPRRFSYYADDLAVLAWDAALVVEDTPGESDVQLIVEFANAQLLELRWFDSLLDGEVRRMYERMDSMRGGARFTRRYAPLLRDLQRTVADATELVERVENALKVTDDVFLARVYQAALDLFRERAWRAGIERKLGIVRETYAMLNAEAQSARMEALELVIVALIAVELVVPFLR